MKFAASEAQVAALVQECMVTLEPDEWSKLPASCQSRFPATREEIMSCAVDLARAELTYGGDPRVKDLLFRMASAFREASGQCRQLYIEGRLRDQRRAAKPPRDLMP